MVKKDLGALVQSIKAQKETPAVEKAEAPVPATTEPSSAPQAQATEVADAPAVKRPTAPAPKSTPPAEPVGETAPGTSTAPASAGIQVMISQELNDRLQSYLAKRKISHATLLLEAIEKTYKRLPDLVADARGLEDDEEDDDDRVFLFERPAQERQQAAGAPRAKHHVRVTPKNRKMLDAVAKQVGAPSRNFMITVAYDAYLPHPTTES
jgi:hypothetical protein